MVQLGLDGQPDFLSLTLSSAYLEVLPHVTSPKKAIRDLFASSFEKTCASTENYS